MTAARLTLVAIGVGAVIFVATMKRNPFSQSPPPVPLPVSATLTHFAPGLAIGAPVERNASSLRSASWTPNVGYFGALKSNRGFTHARLLVNPKDIGNAVSDPKKPVWAVELVAERSDSIPNVMFDLGIAFRGSPRDGCILPSVEGMPMRRVQYWSTRSDQGGVALITDWGEGKHTGPSEVVVWSIFAWTGPFEGGKALFANYDPRLCYHLQDNVPPGTRTPVSIAAEESQLALRDSLYAGDAAAVAQRAAAKEPLVGGEQPDACSLGIPKPTETHSTTLFEIDLPQGFRLTNRDRAERQAQESGYARYEWRGTDNSTFAVFAGDGGGTHSGWTGLIASECDLESVSGPMHIDVANASVSVPDRVVHAALEVPGQLHLMVLAHARSLERQAELIRAARSVRVSPRWGSH